MFHMKHLSVGLIRQADQEGRDKMSKQPGLDGRHRDANGRISEKHGNTRVGTLRETYGDDFASGTRSDAKLSTILDRADVPSLSQFLKKDD